MAIDLRSNGSRLPMGTYQPISIGFGGSVNHISRHRGGEIGKKAVGGRIESATPMLVYK